MFSLPKDLNTVKSDIQEVIEKNLINIECPRLTIEIKFEGIKFNNIGFKVVEILSGYDDNKDIYLTYADQGAVALAQRDNPDIKEKIFTFKSFMESKHISELNSIMVSMLPQPYDFDSFEPMTEKYCGKHISINPKFEDANIGIGSVIRERRRNFVNTWQNLYYLQPLENGALMHFYHDNWLLFKQQNNKYFFIKDFDSKPDKEDIYVNLV